MSEVFTLEATKREDMGKGASRRLRHNNGVPAIIYGGKAEPQAVTCAHNKVIKALESESFHSSVFNLMVGKKKETVILKSLQRHPFRPIIIHMDFLRVSASETITKTVPLTFLNEESSKGVKLGGLLSHSLTEVEVSCKVKDLPAHIDVDVAELDLEQTWHLSDLKLPKGVSLTADASDKDRDLPVVAIHASKKKDDAEEDVAAPVVEDKKEEE